MLPVLAVQEALLLEVLLLVTTTYAGKVIPASISDSFSTQRLLTYWLTD